MMAVQEKHVTATIAYRWQYVYFDRPPMTTSGAEHLAGESYDMSFSVKPEPFKGVSESPTTGRVDEEWVKDRLLIDMALVKPSTKSKRFMTCKSQTRYLTDERKKLMKGKDKPQQRFTPTPYTYVLSTERIRSNHPSIYPDISSSTNDCKGKRTKQCDNNMYKHKSTKREGTEGDDTGWTSKMSNTKYGTIAHG